jgi:tRNA-dihydrouridine synthase B
MMQIGSLSLGSRVCLAPMAGVTDLPFRMIVRKYAGLLAFTEMVSAEGLTRGMAKSRRYLQSLPGDRPLGMQIFGSDPHKMAEAARIVSAWGADLVDINMGCPVKKVLRGGAGAALLKTPDVAARILVEVRRATSQPLTVKIRSGWVRHGNVAREIACIAEDCGADAVILHPRTVEQGFEGRADWRLIGEVKSAVHIPVIGNGDIRMPGDATRMIAETGCDGVMVGRGALGNPWIFEGIMAVLSGRKAGTPSLLQRENALLEHLDMARQYWVREEHCIKNFRKHLLWYTKGLRGGAKFRDRIGMIDNEGQLRDEIALFFKELRAETAHFQVPNSA